MRTNLNYREMAVRLELSMEARMKVFDWKRAARRIARVRPAQAEAGLMEDWRATSATIWRHGWRPGQGPYLASRWAIPILVMDNQEEPCWTWQDLTPWDASTCWPSEALDILPSYEYLRTKETHEIR